MIAIFINDIRDETNFRKAGHIGKRCFVVHQPVHSISQFFHSVVAIQVFLHQEFRVEHIIASIHSLNIHPQCATHQNHHHRRNHNRTPDIVAVDREQQEEVHQQQNETHFRLVEAGGEEQNHQPNVIANASESVFVVESLVEQVEREEKDAKRHYARATVAKTATHFVASAVFDELLHHAHCLNTQPDENVLVESFDKLLVECRFAPDVAEHWYQKYGAEK